MMFFCQASARSIIILIWSKITWCKLMDFLLHRTRLEKAKKEQEDRLEYIKEQLEMYSHDAKRHIKEITTKVEGQVTYNVTLNLEA